MTSLEIAGWLLLWMLVGHILMRLVDKFFKKKESNNAMDIWKKRSDLYKTRHQWPPPDEWHGPKVDDTYPKQ